MRKCSQRDSRLSSVRLMWCLCSVLEHTKSHQRSSQEQDRRCSRAHKQRDETYLGIIVAVLIVLWLFGFFAFDVTTALIHVAPVVGLILLVLHFMRRSTGSV
jgi:Flp pilus assembly protein TadB